MVKLLGAFIAAIVSMPAALGILAASVAATEAAGIDADLPDTSNQAIPQAVHVDDLPVDIPPRVLSAIIAAAQASSCGTAWQILSAVLWRESNYGLYPNQTINPVTGVQEPGHWQWDVAAMGGGPSAFLEPTWKWAGKDFDGDGVANVFDVDDSVYSQAELLCTSGYRAGDPASISDAVGAYNAGSGARCSRITSCRKYRADVFNHASKLAGITPIGIDVPSIGPDGKHAPTTTTMPTTSTTVN